MRPTSSGAFSAGLNAALIAVSYPCHASCVVLTDTVPYATAEARCCTCEDTQASCFGQTANYASLLRHNQCHPEQALGDRARPVLWLGTEYKANHSFCRRLLKVVSLPDGCDTQYSFTTWSSLSPRRRRAVGTKGSSSYLSITVASAAKTR